MSLTSHEEIWRVGRVGQECYENPREDVRNKSCVSRVSASMSRGCYEETAVVEFRLTTYGGSVDRVYHGESHVLVRTGDDSTAAVASCDTLRLTIDPRHGPDRRQKSLEQSLIRLRRLRRRRRRQHYLRPDAFHRQTGTAALDLSGVVIVAKRRVSR